MMKNSEWLQIIAMCIVIMSVTLFVGMTISSFKKIEMLDKQQALLQQRLTSLELDAYRREKSHNCE